MMPTVDGLTQGVLARDVRSLAKAITLLESARPDQRIQADALLTKLLPHSGRSLRIAVSGAPGAGKSTFIEAFGQLLLAQGMRLAVLAIDPVFAFIRRQHSRRPAAHGDFSQTSFGLHPPLASRRDAWWYRPPHSGSHHCLRGCGL